MTRQTPGDPVTRDYGNTRVGTAISASLQEYPQADSASAVVLARDDEFADALAGGPLAAHLRAPLLLTRPDVLDTATEGEVQRVLPAGGTVYILGGPAAVSPAVGQQLESDGYQVIRISGPNRAATAVAIAGQLGDPPVILEATGRSFADAVSAGPAAIVADAAILLTDGSNEYPETDGYLAQHPGDKTYAIGDASVAADPSAVPIAGTDRFETSAMVAAKFFPKPPGVSAADGLSFPDALAGGPLAGELGIPLVLVEPDGALPVPVANYVSAHHASITVVIVFGGSTVVADRVVDELGEAAAGQSQPAPGP
ncbi:MAG: cell wall-binding repeat-containing protein [Acidimicrobiales bacterium]